MVTRVGTAWRARSMAGLIDAGEVATVALSLSVISCRTTCANSTSFTAAPSSARLEGFHRVSSHDVTAATAPRRRPRTLALELVDVDRRPHPRRPHRAGRQAAHRGRDHGRVRRQPHRGARGLVQAAGVGPGARRATASAPSSSASATAATFRIAPEQFATLRDVIAVLELRIGVETEAAGLAAQRRTARQPGRHARRARRASPARSRQGATPSAPTSSSTSRSRARRRTPTSPN